MVIREMLYATRIFSFKTELIFHHYFMHLELKNIEEFVDQAQCFMCDKKLGLKHTFYTHVETTHGFKCEMCTTLST